VAEVAVAACAAGLGAHHTVGAVLKETKAKPWEASNRAPRTAS
jgi:hypothetical protein